MKPTYEELEQKCALQQLKLAAINELMSVVEKASDIAKACIEELQSQNADMAVQLTNAESKCRELAAENAALKKAAEFSTAEDMWIEQADGMLDYRYVDWYVDVLKAAMETPVTDAFLAEVRAQGVEMAACALDDVNQFNYANMLDDLAQKIRQEAAQ